MTPAKVRIINQLAIMEFLRLNKVSSRTAIADALGLSLPSVVRITDDMMLRNLLVFNGQAEKSGGRKRLLLEFNGAGNLVVSAEINMSRIDGFVVDLNGSIYKRTSETLDCTQTELMMSVLKRMVGDLLSFAHTLERSLLGIAIIVPGTTVMDTGEVIQASRLRLKRYPMGEEITKCFGLPTIVENDSNAAAIGELWLSRNAIISDLAFIHLREGLGVGLVVGGEVYRGENSSAGELGHIVLDSVDFQSDYSEYGPVERKVAGLGLTKATLEAVAVHSVKFWSEPVDYRKLFDAYFAGEVWCSSIINDFVDVLSKLIIIINALINPAKIILSGEVMEVASPLLERINQNVYSGIKVEVSAIGSAAVIYGGAVSLLKKSIGLTANS